MIFDVFISEKAENDLIDIFSYIAYSLKAKENAISQLRRIEKSIKGLAEFPERFKKYEHDRNLNRNLRLMPVDNYLVFYTVDNDSKIVYIVRVLYGARDIDKLI